MERRNAVRYRLEVPAVFRWEDPLGVGYEHEGLTQDISVIGAFVLSGTCPPVECRVEVEIVVSKLPEAPRASLKAIMKVLRREDHFPGGCGFSIAGEPFTLGNRCKAKKRGGAIVE